MESTHSSSGDGHALSEVGRRNLRRDAIDAFLGGFASSENADLLAEMLVTICRLAKDECGRGDLKILNTTLKELRYAFKIFEPYREIRKVSIFGSSRTAEDHPDYQQAVLLARRMREANWMVITGAGDGIMRAGHGGAGREASFGVAIRLPFEQATNDIIRDDQKLINFKYFFTRKIVFMKEASAVALFPGGFGTQDEGFEALTLVQTGKAQPVPIVLVDAPGATYWQEWRSYVTAELLGNGMIGPEDMDLLMTTDDVEQAVREITGFYRVYHSSRYVRDNLVLRLRQRLEPTAIEQLNDEFGDLLLKGRIRQVDQPLGEERDEHPDLPRLILRFNRQSFGKLRQLINRINAAHNGQG